MGSKVSTVNEKLGSDDNGREKSGGGVKKTHAGLFPDIGEVTEIPCDEIIDFVKRSQRHVNGIGDKFSVENAA